MKKLLSGVLAAAALLVGATSCSGDLHDDVVTKIDLSSGLYLVGSMQGWKEAEGIASEASVDVDGAIEIPFTADASKMQFKFIPTLGSWDGQIAGDKIVGGDLPANCSCESVDDGYGGINGLLDGFEAKANYKMIVEATLDGKVKVSVKSNVPPTPIYFDNLWLVGSVFKLTGQAAAWDFLAKENLLCNASLDKGKGIVTYTKDIEAIAASGELGINDPNWGNMLGGKGITVTPGEEPVELDGDPGNFKVSGLTEGKPYRVIVKSYPDETVTVEIIQICRYNLVFKAEGFAEDTELFINGSPWSWGPKWPIYSWNKDLADSELEADSAEAKASVYIKVKADYPEYFCEIAEDGTGSFAITADNLIGKPGDVVTYECETVEAKADGCGGSLKKDKFNITVAEGTFTVTFKKTVSGDTVTYSYDVTAPVAAN